LRRVSQRSGVSYTTVRRAAAGEILIKNYDVARKISDATGGAVSVDDLCNPAMPAAEVA
jgi:hypothetical protein